MLRWIIICAYALLVIVEPYSQFLQGNYDRVMQTFCFLALLGWSLELRKKSGRWSEKIMLYALVGHSLWIAITDGKIECTDQFAKRESMAFAVFCALIILFTGGVKRWKNLR